MKLKLALLLLLLLPGAVLQGQMPSGLTAHLAEAACIHLDFSQTRTLAALRGAERLWVRGGGRPVLPVLVQEALAVLWPALYGHARRHLPK